MNLDMFTDSTPTPYPQITLPISIAVMFSTKVMLHPTMQNNDEIKKLFFLPRLSKYPAVTAPIAIPLQPLAPSKLEYNACVMVSVQRNLALNIWLI